MFHWILQDARRWDKNPIWLQYPLLQVTSPVLMSFATFLSSRLSSPRSWGEGVCSSVAASGHSDHRPWPHLTSTVIVKSGSKQFLHLYNTDAVGRLLQDEANSHFLKLFKNRVIFFLDCFCNYIWSGSRILPKFIWEHHNIALYKCYFSWPENYFAY